MKSIAILLSLAFLTGFQAAVISDEPPVQATPEPTVLEQLQDQFGKISTQLTDNVNEGLSVVKGRASEVLVYAQEMGKKYTPTKIPNRKFQYLFKDAQQYGQSVYNQGRDLVKEQYNKAVEIVEEVKKHPAVTTLNEEVITPFVSKAQKAYNWAADQSFASLYNLMYKKLNL